MDPGASVRQQLSRAVQELPPELLPELTNFIEYLRFKVNPPISPSAEPSTPGSSSLGASPSSTQHKALAALGGPVPVAIITVSDSRTPDTDTNAQYLRAQLEGTGHQLVAYRLIPDEPEQVATILEELADSTARVLLFNGGTGISRRDTTYDVLSRKLEKTLPGFGELFRWFSYEQVGAAAMLSRATAGVYRGKVVISTPGSSAAVQLAWEKLIAPELQHLAWEVAR
jgi:molybdenum cofactor biosynthesis protein B